MVAEPLVAAHCPVQYKSQKGIAQVEKAHIMHRRTEEKKHRRRPQETYLQLPPPLQLWNRRETHGNEQQNSEAEADAEDPPPTNSEVKADVEDRQILKTRMIGRTAAETFWPRAELHR